MRVLHIFRSFANEHARKHSFFCLLLVAFLIPLKLSLTYVVLIPSILLWLVSDAGVKDLTRLTAIPFVRPLILFILVVVTTSVFGLRPLVSLQHIIGFAFFALMVPFVAFALKENDFKKVFFSLCLGQSLAAVHTILEALFPQYFSRWFIGMVSESGQLAILIPVSVALLFTAHGERNRRLRYVLSGVVLLLLIALLINLKRGPWLGVFISLMVFFTLYERRIVLPLFAAVGALIFSVEAIRERLAISYQHFIISGGRSTIWSIGSELTAQYPLGIGFENSVFLREFSPEIPPELEHFHNNVLNITVETGWLGVVFYLWWIVAILQFCFRYQPTASSTLIIRGIACAFVSWQVAGLVEYNFGDSEVFLIVLLLMGVLLHFHRTDSEAVPANGL